MSRGRDGSQQRSVAGSNYRSGERTSNFRAGERSQRRIDRADEPALPQDVDPRDLDPEVRGELRSLTKPIAERVARHLIAAGRLVDEDPAEALRHARVARRLGGRLAVVREAVAITAYHAQEWSEALSELRAARRMGGASGLIHVMADCERALGRPERALALAEEASAQTLPVDERIELALVVAGARRDLGQLEAALLVLDLPELRSSANASTVRLQYAYADALVEAGRVEEARDWFSKIRDTDPDESTDAEERLAALG